MRNAEATRRTDGDETLESWLRRRAALRKTSGTPLASAASVYTWAPDPCGRDLARALALCGLRGHNWEAFE